MVVLDNARVHRKAIKERGHIWQERGHIWQERGQIWQERGQIWQERGLFVWFLPTYSLRLTPIKPQYRRDAVAQAEVRAAAARRLRR